MGRTSLENKKTYLFSMANQTLMSIIIFKKCKRIRKKKQPNCNIGKRNRYFVEGKLNQEMNM